MQQRITEGILQAAADISLSIDTALTEIDLVDGTTRIVVTCASTPIDEEAKSFMKAALHIAIMDELEAIGIQGTRVVYVMVASPCSPLVSPRVSEWIAAQVQGVSEWATLCATLLARSALERVIAAYPWRNAQSMRQLVPIFCMNSVANAHNGVHDDTLCGDVDRILPSIDVILSQSDREIVFRDVHHDRGERPKTLLHVYETVYEMVRAGRQRSAPTDVLYSHLFAG